VKKRDFDTAIDAAIAAAQRDAIAHARRKIDAAIAIALREALAHTARKIAKIQDVLSGTTGVKRVWIKRHTVPKHTVHRHRRLVYFKLAEGT
jgi:hypothetical protein